MKHLYLFISVLFLFNVNAQTLTQSANEPVIGDTSRTHLLDTSAFSGGMPNNVAGSNVIWNFQQLNTGTLVITSAYISTTAVSSATDYPGATFVQKQGGLNNFYKSVTSPTTQTEFLGLSSSSVSMIFTNSAIVARFPMNMGTTVNDNFSGSFDGFGFSGNVNGNVSTVADGTGTLNLVDGITLTNVLRVKSVQSLTFTAGFFPIATMKQTIYNYYHSTQKFPVLSINYTSMTQTGQSPTVTASANGNKNIFVVGVKENSLADGHLSIFPNPAQDFITIQQNLFLNPSEVVIYTQLGQEILRKEYSEKINIANLNDGVYYLKVKTQEGTIVKKFIKH